MPVTLVSFNDAIKDSQKYTRRHLLLGNGFSIACIPTIFSYNSLFEEADFNSNPEVKAVFKLLGTTDFELVIESLEKASLLLPAYSVELTELILKLGNDSHRIKELLIETIANRHPHIPADIEDEKYKYVRTFLSNFVAAEGHITGRIYSLNYDLLLYWALMHKFDTESFELDHNDGFGRDKYIENGEPQYSENLTWQGKTEGQNIFYLHGALHLFDSGHDLEKSNWGDTGIPIIDQCRTALENNKFPLFVTEGDYDKKLKKIMHNPYLFDSYESFEAVANGGRGPSPGKTCMFTYGVSFSDNDNHIFNILANGRIKHLYVGIFGDIDEISNKVIIAKTESIKHRRHDFQIEITYYDSSTAKIWG